MPVDGVRLSLWRALTAFRAAALLIDVYLVMRWQPLYRRPHLALLVVAAAMIVTDRRRRLARGARTRPPVRPVVLVDAVVT